MDRLTGRGSEWRKWDLHLHAPGTKLNDQFNATSGDVWQEFCLGLEESDVKAFGITDYFSADCYFNTIAEFNARLPQSTKVFFPNIELRTSYVVNKASEEVNIHLIFNPRPECDAKLREFLQYLKTNKTVDGRHVKAADLSSTRDFEEATTSREFIRDALVETFGNVDLLDHVLIVTAANNDGIRPEQKKRKLALTDELDKFSNAFFGNSRNVAYFLSTTRAEDKSQRSEPKPVLSGSDAHSLTDIRNRLGKVYADQKGALHEPTWIKADLTYEGLKQIIFEPENRVFIGEEPEVERRVRENKTRYIESLHIDAIAGYRRDQHGEWFENEAIPLGKELVAIIGNKGSGKSALTDIIGLLGNSHNQTAKGSGKGAEELFSFLNAAKFLKGGFANNFQGTLNWHDGAPDIKVLGASVATHLPEKVEYLPQKYLERICANIAVDEFRSTLNEVIFRYVEPQDAFGTASLEELIAYLTEQATEDIRTKKQELYRANEIVVSVEKKLTDDYRAQIEEKIRLKAEEVEAHQAARPPEKPKPDGSSDTPAKEAEEVDFLTEKVSRLSDAIDNLQAERLRTSKLCQDLRQARQAIESESAAVSSLKAKYADLLKSAGLSIDRVINVSIDYGDLDLYLSERSSRLQEITAALSAEDDIALTLRDEGEKEAARALSLVCQRTDAQKKKAELVDRLGKPAREYQSYLQALQAWSDQERALLGEGEEPPPESLNGLRAEREKIETAYPEALSEAKRARLDVSKAVFRKKRGLTTFYNSVKQSIDLEIAKCRSYLGEYDISIDAGLRFNTAFFDEFLSYINQGAAGSFRLQSEGRNLLGEICDRVEDWEDEDQVFEALNEIYEALHFDKRQDAYPKNVHRDVFKQLKGNRAVEDLYQYLFGFDYLSTKYDLRIDQKDLSELSPGERGGLLLVFYLMLDKQDIPLVIDQPEDNLDNKSVYETLVTFIKQAKKRRQIILVTHNPNLAVVADAEQVIHVSIEKKDKRNRFDFVSGSIEDRYINGTLVDILEGTLPAFDNRRLKYRKPAR